MIKHINKVNTSGKEKKKERKVKQKLVFTQFKINMYAKHSLKYIHMCMHIYAYVIASFA